MLILHIYMYILGFLFKWQSQSTGIRPRIRMRVSNRLILIPSALLPDPTLSLHRNYTPFFSSFVSQIYTHRHPRVELRNI